MKRKGSISLSMQAIAIVVITIIVLGLVINMASTFLKRGAGQLGELVEGVKLKNPPTADEPLTFDEKPVFKGNQVENEIIINLYCNQGTCSNVNFKFSECINSSGDNTPQTPTIINIKKDVNLGESFGFPSIIKTRLDPGDYICNVQAVDRSTIYAELQTTITVTS